MSGGLGLPTKKKERAYNMTTFYENLIMVKWENFVHGDDMQEAKTKKSTSFLFYHTINTDSKR